MNDWNVVHVKGKPVPQGSMRPMVNRHTGQAIVKANNADKLYAYRNNIVNEIRLARESGNLLSEPFTGIVQVQVDFYLPRPKAHYGTGRNAQTLKQSAPDYPTGPPDTDKLCRALLDSLTYADVYVDDAQVVKLTASKKYTSPSSPWLEGWTAIAYRGENR